MAEDKKDKGTPPASPPEEGEEAKTPSWVDEDPFPPIYPPSKAQEGPRAEEPHAASFSTGDPEAKVEVDPELTAEASQPKAETRRTTSSAGRASPVSTSYRPTFDDSTDPGLPSSRRRRVWGLPIYGWLLVAATLLGAFLLVFDLRNRNRYMLVCKANKVELHKGRTFPWPFGHESIGGPEFKPIAIPAEADCRRRVYQSREEAELGFLDFILSQARTALSNPGTVSLKQARNQVLQAMLLTRTHRTRRKETHRLLAELAYREGRTGLARVENEIRTALARFQEAQKLDGERFEDLDDWIEHLESLLRSVAPSPSGALPPLSGGSSPKGVPRTLYPPSMQSPKGALPQLPSSRPVGKEPSPTDGGAPSSGGILM